MAQDAIQHGVQVKATKAWSSWSHGFYSREAERDWCFLPPSFFSPLIQIRISSRELCHPQWAGRSSCLHKQNQDNPHKNISIHIITVTNSESSRICQVSCLETLEHIFSLCLENLPQVHFSWGYFLDCDLCTYALPALITIVIVWCLLFSLHTLSTLYHKCWPWGTDDFFLSALLLFSVCFFVSFVAVCLFVFKTESYYVDQVGLELTEIFLPMSMTPRQADFFFSCVTSVPGRVFDI